MQQCNPYAFELYRNLQKYPVLCNNTDITSTSPTNYTTGFCTVTWDTCKDVAISNSPFSNDNALPIKLADTYKSATDFCTSTSDAATNQTVCFNGDTSVRFNGTQPTPAPQGIYVCAFAKCSNAKDFPFYISNSEKKKNMHTNIDSPSLF